MQVERNVERLRALEDLPKPMSSRKTSLARPDEHLRIAHAFGANEERQYISAFAE
jgi:hypothetical protein